MASLRNRCFALTLSVFSAGLAAEAPAPSDPYALHAAFAPVGAVAVLPFENRSTRPESVPRAAELYSEVLERLETLSGVHMVAREVMLGYANTSLALGEIARELSVDGVVEATIEDAGPQQLLITIYHHFDNRSSGRTGVHWEDDMDAASIAERIVGYVAQWTCRYQIPRRTTGWRNASRTLTSSFSMPVIATRSVFGGCTCCRTAPGCAECHSPWKRKAAPSRSRRRSSRLSPYRTANAAGCCRATNRGMSEGRPAPDSERRGQAVDTCGPAAPVAIGSRASEITGPLRARARLLGSH